MVAGRNAERFAKARGRLAPALLMGKIREGAARLKPLPAALNRTAEQMLQRHREALRLSTRTLEALSYRRVLDRGYVVVRSETGIITQPDSIAPGMALSLEFARDKHVAVTADDDAPVKKPRTQRTARKAATTQQDLFDE